MSFEYITNCRTYLLSESMPIRKAQSFFVFNTKRLTQSIFFLLVILLSSENVRSQGTWSTQSEHTLFDGASSIAIDAAGDYIYVVGGVNILISGLPYSFQTNNTSSGTTSNNVNAYGNKDAYIAKFTSTGAMIWVVGLGSSGNDEALKVCVGGDGNIYMTGYYFGTMTMPSFDGSPTLTATDNDGSSKSEAFIASYTPDGDARWVRSNGGDDNDYGHSLCAVPGGVVMIGQYTKSGNTNIQGTTPNEFGGIDMFIARYSHAGASSWFITGGAPSNDIYSTPNFKDLRWDIACSGTSIYALSTFASGTYQTYGTSNNPVGSASFISADVGLDYVIHNIDLNGNISWAKSIHQGDAITRGGCIGANSNGVYVSMLCHSNVIWPGGTIMSLGTNMFDGILASLDPVNGNFLWGRSYLNANTSSNNLVPLDMELDPSSNIVIAGQFRGTLNLSPSNYNSGSTAYESGFVASFSITGAYLGGHQIVGTNTVLCSGLAVNPNDGSAIVCGTTSSDLLSGLLALNFSDDSYISSEQIDVCSSLNAGVITLANTEICTGSSVSITTSGAIGDITWETSTDSINWSPAATSSLLTLTPSQTTFVRNSVTYAGCSTMFSSPRKIKVYSAQISTAGIDFTVCSTNANLNANTPIMPSTGQWMVATGTGLFSNTTSPTSTVSGFTQGTNTYRWVINNGACGLSVDDITITTDTTPPSAPCPMNEAIIITNDCWAYVPNYRTLVNALDDCTPQASLVYSQIPAAGAVVPVNTPTTIQISFADMVGNTTTCSFLYEVFDGQSPTINCPTVVPVNTDPGTCIANINLPNPVVLDNCTIERLYWTMTGATVDSSPNNGIFYVGTHSFNVGTTTITYFAVDAGGNTTNCAFDVTILDTTTPTISCGGNFNFNVTPGTCGKTFTTSNPLFWDNCSITKLTWAITGTTTANSPTSGINFTGTRFFNVGLSTVTFTASDAAGNSASCSYTVSIHDNSDPVINCPADYTVTADVGFCSATIALPAPVFSDNCSVTKLEWNMFGATTGSSSVNGINIIGTHTFNVGITTIVYEAEDAEGNDKSCSFTVTVTENTPPSLACPADISLSLISGCSRILMTSNPIATDNCSVVRLVWNMTGATTGSSVSLGINYVGSRQFNVGITTITYTAFDLSGNSNSCSFQVTLLDEIAPSIFCPPNITTTTDPGVCTAFISDAVLGAAIGNDNCGVMSTTNNHPSNIFDKGITEISWTTADYDGSSATCTQLVIVADIELPTIITCPSDTIINTDPGTCEATFALDEFPIVSDNCMTVLISNSYSAPSFPIGTSVVSWKVIDTSDNSSTCTQTITVVDDEAPVFTSCPSDIMIGSTAMSCDAILANPGTPVVTDNCSTPIITNDHPSSIYPPGTTIITWTALDDAGNSATCQQTITVSDTTAPVFIVCPPALTLGTDPGMCHATITQPGVPAATDNCSQTTITNNHSSAIYSTGTTTVIWTATDVDGNSSTCTQIITVLDNEAPVINSCPAPIITGTSTTSCGATLTNIGIPSATDNCSVPSFTNDRPSTPFPLGATTVQWTVSDMNGNFAECDQLITILDDDSPILNCTGDISVNAETGLCSKEVNIPNATYFDNCSIISLTWTMSGATVDNSSSSGIHQIGDYTFNVGTTHVLYEVRDGANNTDQCSYDVVVHDTEGPQINCPLDVHVATDPNVCSATLVAAEIGGATGMDNCGTYTISSNQSSTIFPTGTTTIEWTITDAQGLTANCTQQIIVTDSISPLIICPSDIVVATDSTSCDAIILDTELGFPSIIENCSYQPATHDHPSTQFPMGENYVTWIVQDLAGNSASCTQLVTVNDSIAPLVSTLPTVIVELDSLCEYVVQDFSTLLSASDNCTSSSSLIITQSLATGSILSGTDSTQVTLRVVDQSGNFTEIDFTLEIKDTIAPQFVCPLNQTIAVTGSCSGIVGDYRSLLDAHDNCTGDDLLQIEQLPSPGSTINAATTVTFSIKDASMNEAGCSIIVTPLDTIPPTITLTSLPNLYVDELCTMSYPDFTEIANIIDNCTASANIQITQTPAANDAIDTLGWHAIILTATDLSGNSTISTFEVLVQDSLAPEITCITNYEIQVGYSCEAFVPDFSSIIFTNENCEHYAFTQTPSAGENIEVGIHTVQFEVTDDSNNSSYCAFTLTVSDNQTPSIWVDKDVDLSVSESDAYMTADSILIIEQPISGEYLETELQPCTYYVSIGQPFTLDNCAIQSVQNDYNNSADASDFYPTGHTNVHWIVEDVHGNFTYDTTDVYVIDDTPVNVICPNDTIIQNNGDQCEIFVTLGQPILVNECGNASWQNDYNNTNNASDLYANGITTVQWTATDDWGNVSICAQTVEIIDIQLPQIICPPDTVINADPLTCFGLYNEVNPTITDNCTGVYFTSTNSGNLFPIGTTAIQLTAIDAADNESVCYYTVEIRDIEAPIVNCPTDTLIVPDNGQCYATFDNIWIENATDCSPFTIYNDHPSQQYHSGTTTVLWIIEDSFGNETTCHQFVTVDGVNLSSINNCPADQVVLVNENCEFIVPDYINANSITAVDECGDNITLVQNPAPSSSIQDDGIVMILDSVTQSVLCQFNLNLTDTIKPTITCPSDIVINVITDCSAWINPGIPVVNDNCLTTTPIHNYIAANDSEDASAFYSVGNTSVVWFVQDASGNENSCVQHIQVLDTIAPTIICPSDAAIYLTTNSCVEYVEVPIPNSGDNCIDIFLSNSLNNSSNASGNFEVGNTIIQWTVTDNFGNSTSCTHEVIVFDTISPTIICPSDLILYNTNSNCTIEYIHTELPMVNDNCDINYTYNDHLSNEYQFELTEVIWTTVDYSGNESSCIQNITVLDTIAPVLECNDVNLEMWPSELSSSWIVVSPFMYENCTIAALTNSFNYAIGSVHLFDEGTHEMTWTAIDESGNVGTCTAHINVSMIVIPILYCQDTLEIETDFGVCTAMVELSLPTADQTLYHPTYINDFTENSETTAQFNLGTTDVTWMVNDENGFMSSCVTTVIVSDLVLPVVTCQDTVTVLTSDNSCEHWVVIESPNVSENCAISSIANSYNDSYLASDYYPIGNTVIQWNVFDISNNLGNCLTTVQVIDVTQPQLVCPNDTLIALEQDQTYIVPDYSYTLSSDPACQTATIFSQSVLAGTELSATTAIVLSATDDSNIETQCEFTISIINQTPPLILACPDTISLFLVEDCLVQVTDRTGDIGTNQIEASSPYTIYQYPEVGFMSAFEEMLLWIVDENGLSSDTCHVPVNLIDNLEPTLLDSVPAILYLDYNCEAVIPEFSQWFSYSDNCGDVFTYVQSPEVNTVYVGEQTVNALYWVMDESGNMSTEPIAFQIQIINNQVPIVEGIQQTSLYLDNNCEIVVPDFSSSVQVTNCGQYSISQSINSGETLSGVQNTTIEIIITNLESNLSASHTIQLNLIDSIAPTLLQQEDLFIDQTIGECTGIFDPEEYLEASDACDTSVSIQLIGQDDNVFEIGTYEIMYFAIDESGNQSDTLSFHLTIEDTETPTFVEVNDTTVCDPLFQQIIYVLDCGGLQIANHSNSSLQPGDNLLTYEYSDGTHIVTYSYHVYLAEMPSIQWQQIEETLCANGAAVEMNINTEASYQLYLDAIQMTSESVNPSALSPGMHEITIEAEYAGCESQLSQTFEVIALPEIQFAMDTIHVCGLEVTLNINSSEPVISWTSATNLDVQTVDATTVDVISDDYLSVELISSALHSGCIAQDTITLHFIEQPVAPNAGPDQEQYLQTHAELTGISHSLGITEWSIISGNGQIQNPAALSTTITNLSYGLIEVELTTANEICMSSDTVSITISGLNIPNGFSPNGDGANDTFAINGISNMATSELNIYNRWGQLVYESDDYRNEWEGQNFSGDKLSDDTYFYELILDGEPHHGFVIIKR